MQLIKIINSEIFESTTIMNYQFDVLSKYERSINHPYICYILTLLHIIPGQIRTKDMNKSGREESKNFSYVNWLETVNGLNPIRVYKVCRFLYF